MPRLTARDRLPGFLAVLIVLLLPLAAAADEKARPADWTQLFEHWYTLEIGGLAAGWMRETASDDGRRYRRRICRGA